MSEQTVRNYFLNKLNIVLIFIGIIIFAIGLIVKGAILVLGLFLIIIPILIFISKKVSDEDYLKCVEEYIGTTKAIALSKLGIDESEIDEKYIFTWENNRDFGEYIVLSNFKKKYYFDGVKWTYLFFDDKKAYCCNVFHAMHCITEEERRSNDLVDKSIINIKDITDVKSETKKQHDYDELREVISIQPSSGKGFVFDTRDDAIFLKLKKIIDDKKNNL